MAGIGDYEKGKAFELRSGKSPAFKMMGSSPMKQPNIQTGFGSEADAVLSKKINVKTNKPVVKKAGKNVGIKRVKKAFNFGKKAFGKAFLPGLIAWDAATDKSDKSWYDKTGTAIWNTTIGFGTDVIDAGVRLATGRQTGDISTTPWATDGSVRQPWVGYSNKELIAAGKKPDFFGKRVGYHYNPRAAGDIWPKK